MNLPDLFVERLRRIFGPEPLETVLKTMAAPTPVSIRVNPLVSDRQKVFEAFKRCGVDFKEVPWYKDAFILPGGKKPLEETQLTQDGAVYIQGLSSMLPALVLDPRPGESVLDMCAAPGSKTTQMAALMQNRGRLLCLESVRERYYKLRAVVTQMRATIVEFKLTDARRFKTSETFDKVLVDAPCSSEGRFKIFDKKTTAYWSPRKIKEMAHKQRGLLMTASRLLKSGGVLVYSTCTFAPEENEGAVDWILRKAKGLELVAPVAFAGVKTYPALVEWEKPFNPEVKKSLRVFPDETMEGFFIAKFIKR